MNLVIRKYFPEDREYLRNICILTAGDFFRKSENLLNAVPLIYNDYFTENEPENIFVLSDENNIPAGYIICCADTAKFSQLLRKKYMPAAIKTDRGMLPACIGYLYTLHTSGKKNPVHLHIDISPEYQHCGYGSKLIDQLREHLYLSGINELHVLSVDKKSPAFRFYIKYGFSVYKHYTKNLVSLVISTEIKKDGKNA